MNKFPDTYQIVEMLKHFELEHRRMQQALIDSGEGGRVKPWLSGGISVKDLESYVYKKEGLRL